MISIELLLGRSKPELLSVLSLSICSSDKVVSICEFGREMMKKNGFGGHKAIEYSKSFNSNLHVLSDFSMSLKDSKELRIQVCPFNYEYRFISLENRAVL